MLYENVIGLCKIAGNFASIINGSGFVAVKANLYEKRSGRDLLNDDWIGDGVSGSFSSVTDTMV